MNAQGSEEPVLWLALLGFAPDEELAIWSALDGEQGAGSWRPGTLSGADACLVHGGRVEVLGNADISVRAFAPDQQTVRIDLHEMTRPVAFAAPVPAGLQVRDQFSLTVPEDVGTAVSGMRDRLLALRTRFALGREIVRAGPALRHSTFQLLGSGRNVLAQLDFRTGQAALSPRLTPGDLEGSRWSKAAPLQRVPADFLQLATTELSWTYAKHSGRDLLPSAYRERPIFYRGAPRVPLSWLSDEQLKALTELTASPQMLEELAMRTRMSVEGTVTALTPLYFASAITSTPAKAALESHRRRFGSTGFSTGGEPSPSIAPESAEQASFQVPTVPGALRHR